MPLSDKEIKELLEKAGIFRKAKGNVLPYLEQSLDCYSQVIANAPAHSYYFSERAEVKYRLSQGSNRNDLLDSAIEDINKALQMDPDRGKYYQTRGFYLWEKLKKEDISSKNQLMKNIIADYKLSLSKEPAESNTWLDLIAINVICRNWDEAISLYGQCKPYIDSKEKQLIRAYLGCLALIFTGDSVEEEDKKPLYDQTIRLDYLNTREVRINSFLGDILEEEGQEERLNKAIEIEKLIITHYEDGFNRGNLLSKLRFYEEALKAYEEAIKLDPNYILAWHNKGWILKKLKRYEEALVAINTTIRFKPDDVDFWDDKGGVLSGLERFEEAVECYDKALALRKKQSRK